MSFGVSVGDFIAVGSLARQLYKDIYLIARDAPEELQLLNSEIGVLALSIELIIEDIKDENSTLVRAGGSRMRMVGEIMKQANATLKDLEAFAQKYDFNHSSTKGKGRRIWDRIKFSAEVKSVESLRAKISQHNGTMSLLLTSAGNSSLERIENLSNKMQQNVVGLQDLMSNPRLSGIEERSYQLSLCQAFMKEAEIFRPWLVIGFDEWIRAARWWLLKAQSSLYTDKSTRLVPAQAFADLLKASFLFIDIFPQHPQRRFWRSEYLEVEILAEAVKNEFKTIEQMGYIKPDLNLVEMSDLRIWADAPPAVSIRPKPRSMTTSGPGAWLTQSDEVIWKVFGSCTLSTEEALADNDCIIMILVSHDTKNARIVVQNQRGIDCFNSDISFDLLVRCVLKDTLTPTYTAIVRYSTGLHAHPNFPFLVLSNFKLTFSNENDVSDFTAILTAIVLHQELQGVARTIGTLRGIILLLTITRGNRDLIAEHLSTCQSYYKDHPFLIEEDLKLLSMAIFAASQVLNTELIQSYSEMDDSNNSVLPTYRLSSWAADGKSYVISCWLCAILCKPIFLRLDWEGFALSLSIQFPKPPYGTYGTCFHPGLAIICIFSIFRHSTICILILEKCASIGKRMPFMNRDIISAMDVDLDRHVLAKCGLYKPSLYGECDSSDREGTVMLWAAIMADNGPAASYLLKRVIPDKLPRLQHVQHLIDGQRFPALRLALIAGSYGAVQSLLTHYQPRANERIELLDFLLDSAFNCWFYEEDNIGSTISSVMRHLLDSINEKAIERHKNALTALLEHAPGYEDIDLDRAFVRALLKYNIPAAQTLASSGAKMIPEAEAARTDILTTVARSIHVNPVILKFQDEFYFDCTLKSHEGFPIPANISKDILWLYGGKYDIQNFSKLCIQDPSYWENVKGAEELDRKIKSMKLKMPVETE